MKYSIACVNNDDKNILDVYLGDTAGIYSNMTHSVHMSRVVLNRTTGECEWIRNTEIADEGYGAEISGAYGTDLNWWYRDEMRAGATPAQVQENLSKQPINNSLSSELQGIVTSDQFRSSVASASWWAVRSFIDPILGQCAFGGTQATIGFPVFRNGQLLLDAVAIGRLFNMSYTNLTKQGRMAKHNHRVGQSLGGRPKFKQGNLRQPIDTARHAAWNEVTERVLNKILINQQSIADLSRVMASRIARHPVRTLQKMDYKFKNLPTNND